MMFFVLPEVTNAQRHCPAGQFLVCDEKGKHCKCVSWHPYHAEVVVDFFRFKISRNLSLGKAEKILVKIFDMTGRLLKTLTDKIFEQGDHELQ